MRWNNSDTRGHAWSIRVAVDRHTSRGSNRISARRSGTCEQAGGLPGVVIVPVGFLSDHVEVLYDLDVQVRAVCGACGVLMVRAGTVGTHPRFVQMIRELVVERLHPEKPRLAVGQWGPSPDVCSADCCPYPSPRGGQAVGVR